MDIAQLREGFDALTPHEQLEFIASVGPAFCRKVMADPALRGQMVARCLRADACSLRRISRALQRAGITVTALIAGVRTAATHLRRRASPGPAC